MAGGSISDPCIIDDDDPYFPPLTNPYIIVDDYSIPDEKYAEQLQLHEAPVFSSASRASTSSSPKTPVVILDGQASRASTSSSPKTPVVILDGQASRASTSSRPTTPVVILDGQASSASTSSIPKTPVVILDGQASRASTSSRPTTPVVILDGQASRASTSSRPTTPVVILDGQASRASTSSSPKTPVVILDGQASRASTSSRPTTPVVKLDGQASRALTSSRPTTPIVILDGQSSRALTSSSPKTPVVILDSEDAHAFESSQVADRFCDICMDTKTESEMFRNTKVCGHMFCLDCIRGHVAAKIQENITKVRCPDPNCKGIIGPEACRLIVPREVLGRWEDALCESLILGSEKFYCPFKDCSALLVDDGGSAVTSSECPHCNRLFCAQCKVTWHSGITCSEYQSLSKDERDLGDLMLRDLAKNKKWNRCPKCNFYVEKISGCNHVICRCGHPFTYMSM